MDSSQFDVRYLDNLILPFDAQEKELSNTPRLVAGQNMWVTPGGKLQSRPAFIDAGAATMTKRIDRIVWYETIEASPKVFLVASAYNSGSGRWELYYANLDASPSWTKVPDMRDINVSTKPHEMAVHNGSVWVRGVPPSGGDGLGTVVLDGTGGTMTTNWWGMNPALLPFAVTSSAGWNASANPVTVRMGWTYVYAYKSKAGAYSTRTPLQNDPSAASSNTGAFTNKKPAGTIVGLGDTTNIPKIAVFRTTDGGGNFCFLEEINNTGAASITYEDNHRVPSNTDNPQLDSQIDTSQLAPSLVSHLPPPPCAPPHRYGDIPEVGTTIESYQRRLWYGIGNRLWFSGQEEIFLGVPEHCFPGAYQIGGNWFTFSGQLRMLESTSQALYVITSQGVHAMLGQDRSNFRPVLISRTGGIGGHPMASCTAGDAVFFVTNDLQIAGIAPNQGVQIISLPLGTAFSDALLAAGQPSIVLTSYSRDGMNLLLAAVVDRNDSDNTVVFTYDLDRQIWFTPWTGTKITAMTAGNYKASDMRQYLIATTWDGTTARVTLLDRTAVADALGAFPVSATTNLFTLPAGNHINELRKDGHHPMLAYLLLDRTKFTGDSDPTVSFRLDEFAGTLTPVNPVDPPYIAQSVSYNTRWYPIQLLVHRAQLQIDKPALNEKFEVQNMGFVFQPEVGS